VDTGFHKSIIQSRRWDESRLRGTPIGGRHASPKDVVPPPEPSLLPGCVTMSEDLSDSRAATARSRR
jgi:hypothetical protein